MIKHFSHNDLDGYSCILLSQLVYGLENVSFAGCNHEEINEEVGKYLEDKEYLNYKHCYITDISINDELVSKINSIIKENPDLNEHFKLIDHHISAIELNEYDWCHVEIKNEDDVLCCGTSLYFDYLRNTWKEDKVLTNPLLQTYVEKVRRLDIWDWQKLGDIESKQNTDLFSILGKERFMEYWFNRLTTDMREFYFNDVHRLLLDIRQNEINDYIESKEKKIIPKDILGYKAGVVFANRFQSELGNQLSELHPEYDFIALINVDGGVSLRTTKEDINLATEVAAVFGGGGHAKASGMRVPSEVREMVINTVFCLDESASL